MVRHFTVREFAQKHRRSDETVRRWINSGKIYPAPTFDGYQYLIHPSAQKITNYEKLNPSKMCIRDRQSNEPPMDFSDDIPFAPIGLPYPRHAIYVI